MKYQPATHVEDIDLLNMTFYLMYLIWEDTGFIVMPTDYDIQHALNKTEVFDDYCYMYQ